MPRPEPPVPRLPTWSWLVLWGALVGVALALRPLLPVDETRYLSVAWEMWLRGDWLVPHLNGAPYSDKPPLLLWGILLGWRALGVNQWWPRLLPPLFGLISALLLVRLTGRLRPGPEPAGHALPFLSGLLWVTFSTLLLFDTLLTTCVLVALTGVVEAWRGRALHGWGVCGAGIGLGVLAKGPVVLVHVLPAALLAPWWAGGRQPAGWRRWYLGLVAAVGLGAAIGLAWALPAAARGGPDYASAILWEQTAGRITGRLAHDRPWWWYLPLLPLVLYPWALWPALWRSLARVRRNPMGVPVGFALAWVVPGLVALSSLGGKQIHYLMPLLPGVALLAADVCSDVEPHRWDAAAPAGLVALAGILLWAGAGLRHALGLPAWLGEVSPTWGLILLAEALVLATSRRARGQVLALSLTGPALMLVVHLAGSKPLGRRYDLRPVAELLEAGERAGRPIAFVGHYAGQFHFLGRLLRPIEDVPRGGVAAWAERHPDGLVVRQVRSADGTAGALLARPYGEGMVGVWTAVRGR